MRNKNITIRYNRPARTGLPDFWLTPNLEIRQGKGMAGG